MSFCFRSITIWQFILPVVLLIFCEVRTPEARAGYVFVRKAPCTKKQNPPSEKTEKHCIEPMQLNDPNETHLYQILLDHTWPTAEIPVENEKEHIEKALTKANLIDDYQFVWVPDTIQDIDCAHVLLSLPGTMDLSSDGVVIKELDVTGEDDPFTSDSNEAISKILNLAKQNSNATISPERRYREYFRQIDLRGTRLYFECNKSLADLLFKRLTQTLDDKKLLRDMEQLFLDLPIQRAIRADVANRYQSQVKEVNKIVSSPVIEVDSDDLDPNQDSILDQIIQLEIDSYRHDEILLFRGTGGVATLDGGIALDDPFFDSAHGTSNASSLSFGSSIFAGIIRESRFRGSSATACAMNYFRSKKFGYVLRIQRNDPQIEQLFEIPPVGLITRLYSRGEYFHPRSKVGIKNIANLDAPILGIASHLNHSVSDLLNLNILVNPGFTSLELSQNFNRLLSNHAQLITYDGSRATPEVNQTSLTSQRLISKSFNPTTERFYQIVQTYQANPFTYAAAVRELGKFYHLDTSSFTLIVEILDHSTPLIRKLAIGVLNATKPVNLTADLQLLIANKLGEDDFVARHFAGTLLSRVGKLDPRVYQIAMGLMERDSEDIRKSVTLFASDSEILDPNFANLILKALEDQDENVRYSALSHFENRPPSDKAIPKIVALLNDNVSYIQRLAKSVLKIND